MIIIGILQKIKPNRYYMVGNFFEIDKEKRNFVYYKPSKNLNNVFINMGEIECTNADFDCIKMTQEEYVSTQREIFNS